MNCGIDQFDVELGVLVGARSLDALDFVKVERSWSGIQLLSGVLSPEGAGTDQRSFTRRTGLATGNRSDRVPAAAMRDQR